jgi:hypothetical protein
MRQKSVEKSAAYDWRGRLHFDLSNERKDQTLDVINVGWAEVQNHCASGGINMRFELFCEKLLNSYSFCCLVSYCSFLRTLDKTDVEKLSCVKIFGDIGAKLGHVHQLCACIACFVCRYRE